VDQLLTAIEQALLRAALQEHPDRAAAAAAVCLPFDAFEARLERYDLRVPRARRPESIRGPSIIWCARQGGALAVDRDECDSDPCGFSDVDTESWTGANGQVQTPGGLKPSSTGSRTARPAPSTIPRAMR
jgi:hypothetical protein